MHNDPVRRLLSSDSELDDALARLAAAREDHVRALRTTTESMRFAAQRVTNVRLKRWEACATKQFGAQMEVVAKHGLPTGLSHGSPMLMAKQMKHSWLGNTVGLVLPIWTFGPAVLSRGLTLPLIWLAAVTADIAGKTRSLKSAPAARATLMEQELLSPAEAAERTRDALEAARAGFPWENVVECAKSLRSTQAHLQKADDALLRRARTGKRSVFAAVILAIAAQLIAVSGAWQSVMPHGASVVLSLAAPILVVFAISRWVTCASYEEAVSRPPYPEQTTFQALRTSIHYERVMTRELGSPFTSVQEVRQHTTKAMLKVRQFAVAFRALERTETAMNRLEREIVDLVAERRALELPGDYETIDRILRSRLSTVA